MPKLLVREDRNNRFGYRAEYIEVPKKELNQLRINPLYGLKQFEFNVCFV